MQIIKGIAIADKDGLLFRICQYVEFKQKARRENEKL